MSFDDYNLRSRVMFIAGVAALTASIALIAYNYLAPRAADHNVLINDQIVPPVADRVKNVVLLWSQDQSIADSDKLEEIWGRTRNSGHHDYDFSPGGIYDLDRLLTLEFSKFPRKQIPSPVSFGSSGKIKTLGDLLDAMQGG